MKTRQWMAAAAMLACGIAGAQTVVTQGNAKDDLFAGTNVFEKNATNVTEITQGPRTLDMVNGKDESRAHRTLLNVVRTYSYDKDGLYNMADVDVYRNKLNTGGWECSVHERNLKTGSSTDVCDKPRTDGLKESAIITVSPRSLTFIHTIRKTGPGDEGENGAPVAFMFNGPDLAMLDGQMATLDGQMAAMQLRMQAMPPNALRYQLRVPRSSAITPAAPAEPAAPTTPAAPAAKL